MLAWGQENKNLTVNQTIQWNFACSNAIPLQYPGPDCEVMVQLNTDEGEMEMSLIWILCCEKLNTRQNVSLIKTILNVDYTLDEIRL